MTAPHRQILIVDDDPDSVLFLCSLVRSQGFDPVAAGSMAEGFGALDTCSPSCIILNCMMCGDQGVCFYRALRTHNTFKNVPVIMLSSIRRDTMLRSGLLRGAQAEQTIREPEAFLDHPPDADALIGTVKWLTGASA